MYKIVRAEELTTNIYLFEVEAKRVAKACLPGQFVIVRTGEDGERIPLTISDYNREKGTITIVVQTIGAGTNEMRSLKAGDFFHVYPQVKWLHEHGVLADVIIGAKTKDLLIYEEEMKKVAGNVYPTTDDGSYGRSGMVTNTLKDLVEKEGRSYDVCVAIGPMIMMKFVCLTTKELGIKTIVSMNPIMVDGTGMCGACRLTVGGEVKFACVDGPEFDGHLVDFDQAMKRQQIYKTAEGRALLKQQEGDTHHGGCGHCGGDK